MSMISGIDAILASVGAQGNNGLVLSAGQNESTSFLQSLQRLNNTVSVADSNLQAYATGAPISTHELMISMEQAKISMQVAVEVRNRLVDAYQELFRMQV